MSWGVLLVVARGAALELLLAVILPCTISPPAHLQTQGTSNETTDCPLIKIIHMIITYRSMIGHYITSHLADACIQSDLQLIRLSRRHTPWSNVGLRALLKGPTAVQILSWPRQGSNHQTCGSKSISLTTTLQAALQVKLKLFKMSENGRRIKHFLPFALFIW